MGEARRRVRVAAIGADMAEACSTGSIGQLAWTSDRHIRDEPVSWHCVTRVSETTWLY